MFHHRETTKSNLVGSLKWNTVFFRKTVLSKMRILHLIVKKYLKQKIFLKVEYVFTNAVIDPVFFLISLSMSSGGSRGGSGGSFEPPPPPPHTHTHAFSNIL